MIQSAYFYMLSMKLNPHISIDCVVFGFNGQELKILAIRRKLDNTITDLKLPGDFISDDEDLNSAANRILFELTGLSDIYLHQFHVFGKPDRIKDERDIHWLRKTTGLPISRVVTIAYYSLIRIHESSRDKAKKQDAGWYGIDDVELAFDHRDILEKGLSTLRNQLQFKPIGMELLPEKFTIRQLQNLYEIILSRKLDNRNFRKKVLKANYLIPLEEKENRVAHKPARMYSFNKEIYRDSFNPFDGFQF